MFSIPSPVYHSYASNPLYLKLANGLGDQKIESIPCSAG